MPFYDVSYCYPLDDAQRQEIAERITTLHCTMFNAPALFVNIRFSPIKDEEYWYGGKRKTNTNRIFGHVRSGSNRSQGAFAQLAEEIETIWNEVVGRTSSDIGPNNHKLLQAVFIIPGITAREEGLAIPPAGTESSWLRENLASFQERAGRGDEDFQDLINELKDRPELLG